MDSGSPVRTLRIMVGLCAIWGRFVLTLTAFPNGYWRGASLQPGMSGLPSCA